MYMELVDFTKCERNMKFYGGASGQKYGIVLDGEDYILKFPQNIKDFRLLFPTSYSTNAFSEYIGSHFYEFMGLPVHETVLGTVGKHFVVACKDFCKDEYSLYEFSKISNAFVSGDDLPSPSRISSDKGIVLSDILSVIDGVPQIEPIRTALKERFWEMFIVDALIANPDRNNGNWGILVPFNDKRISSAVLSPVFDNGNSLNAKLSEEAIANYRKKGYRERKESCLKTASIFQTLDANGEPHKINPYSFVQKGENPDCTNAFLRLKDRIPKAIERLSSFVDDIEALSSERKEFYKESVRIRYEEGLLPFLDRVAQKDAYRTRMSGGRGFER